MAALLEREEWKAFSDFTALAAAAFCAFIGLILAVAGKDPVIAFHGCVLLGAAGLAFLYILTNMIEQREPHEATGYADGVVRAGVIATVFWGVAGFLVGVIIAWQLAYPGLNLDLPWTSFGRLRPLHTSAVIFAFGGNILIASSFYVVQRTSCARLAGRWSPWFVFWGYQLFIVLAATGYMLGVTQSQGICRARMVRRSLADCRLGGLFPRLRRHARQAPRAAHLRGELVLSRLHRHHRHAAHRQQSGGAGLAPRLEELS